MTTASQQFNFGSGLMFGTRTDIAGSTPVQFGTLQDVSLDFSFSNKDLLGQYQLPVATARGAAKLSGKAKFARLDPAAFSDLFFGQPRTLNTSEEVAAGEAQTVPGTAPYTVTVTNAATFADNLGVTYAATGLSLTLVASSPTTGQYAFAAGVYTFAAGDEGAAVLIAYTYTAASGSKLVLTNQLMGAGPTFKLRLFQAYNGRNAVYEFNQVQSTKLSLDFKNEDWTIPELDFSFFTDASNTLGSISFSS
jgi:hypothetical protein